MTPRQFLKKYTYDARLISGDYFSSDPLDVQEGDRIGVVLFNLGGPYSVADVTPFLYNLFMDPAIIDIPLRGIWRHWLASLVAKMRGKNVAKDYEQIGGGSPLNRLTEDQATYLEKQLNETYGKLAGVTFHTYVAMRYWHPSSEEAARQMERDGITRVVLLPLYPQYSKTSTGSSLIYWWMLEKEGEIPSWPTAFVSEYAANPRYIQAISERIDEALQRFPKEIRNDVQLVFSAQGTPLREMKERRDPYCCLIHSTVEQVMRYREQDRAFHVAFQSKVGPAEWLTPGVTDKLQELAQKGVRSVLMVPVAYVSDHAETAFKLDIEVREKVSEYGIEHYEVSSGLNSHPLFIEALAEVTVSQLKIPHLNAERVRVSGDGAPGPNAEYPLRPLNHLPRFKPAQRCTRCHQCGDIAEARCWTVAQGENVTPEIDAKSSI